MHAAASALTGCRLRDSAGVTDYDTLEKNHQQVIIRPPATECMFCKVSFALTGMGITGIHVFPVLLSTNQSSRMQAEDTGDWIRKCA